MTGNYTTVTARLKKINRDTGFTRLNNIYTTDKKLKP